MQQASQPNAMQQPIKELLKAIAEQSNPKQLREALFEKRLLARAFAICPDAEQAAKLTDIVFKRLSDLDKQVELARAEWDEFKNKACTDWKRVRAEIEHENLLINHRLGWLFTSQIFLLGGFAAVFQASLKENLLTSSLPVQVVLLAISVVAVSICAFVTASVDAAHKQIEFLENWWFAHYLSKKLKMMDIFCVEKLTDHPPINGIFDEWLYTILSTKWMPVPIALGWLALMSAVFFEKILKIEQPVVPTVASTTVVFGLGVGLFYFATLRRKRPNRKVGSWKEPAASS